jgi:hypothetical protein
MPVQPPLACLLNLAQRPSPDAFILTLDFLASRTMRNKLLYKKANSSIRINNEKIEQKSM